MKKWLGIAMVAAVSLLALGLVASGQDFGQFGHQGGAGGFGAERGFERGHGMAQRALAMLENERVKAYLNLTDPQAQQLREIVVNTEKSSVQTGAELAVRGIELRELLRTDSLDRDAVMKKVQEISDLRGQMMKQHVQALLDAEKVLTPEQRKKIRQFIENREAFGMRPQGFGERRGLGERPREGQGRPPAATPRPGEPPVN